MTPTQIAALAEEYVRRAVEFEEGERTMPNLYAAAAWRAAAALLLEASNAKGRRRFTPAPMDTCKVNG